MPAIPQTFLDKTFARALAGTHIEVRATPQGRNSQDRDDRPACCGNASCIPVCPVQAKYDATVHLDSRDGGRRDRSTSRPRRSSSRSAPIGGSPGSASSAGTAARAGHRQGLRPRRACDRDAAPAAELALGGAPNGVANGSDQVGRNLMDHPTQLSWALAGSPVWPYRGPLSTSGIENLRDGEFRRQRGAFRIEIGNDGWSWPTGAPITTAADLAMPGLRGAALDEALPSRPRATSASPRWWSSRPTRRTASPSAAPANLRRAGAAASAYRLDDYTKAGLCRARSRRTTRSSPSSARQPGPARPVAQGAGPHHRHRPNGQRSASLGRRSRPAQPRSCRISSSSDRASSRPRRPPIPR